MNSNKRCFVICPFDLPSSEVRKRSDMLLEYVIKPTVTQYGYLVDRSDISAQPGIVTINVIEHLIEDELVVADITDRNPNVFYELAIRHAIRKPYIQVISVGQKIPFNIQEIQTVIYDLSDVKNIRDTIEMMQKQIIFYESGGKVTSPVTVAIDELIGTRTLTQFSELARKLSDLDKSITNAQQLSKQLEDVKKVVVAIQSRIETISNNASKSNNTNSSDEISSQQAPKFGPKEYTIKEWIDMDIKRREDDVKKRNL